MIEPAALVPSGAAAVFAGAIVLGLVHGAEPGHGWPVAATYALDRERKWTNGLLASTLLGLGHLVSSLAVVAVFFLAKSYFELASIDRPLSLLGLRIGGPVSVVAGLMLIALGVREYVYGHSHGHSHGRESASGNPPEAGAGRPLFQSHEAALEERVFERVRGPAAEDRGDRGRWWSRLRGAVPVVGDHGHRHLAADDLDTTGLWGIVWTAFVLGFAHEEEIEIVGLCLGSVFCLELMLAYALAVIVSLVGLTMLLIAGYERYEDRVEGLAKHFPTISAVVLIAMGLGFVLGLL